MFFSEGLSRKAVHSKYDTHYIKCIKFIYRNELFVLYIVLFRNILENVNIINLKDFRFDSGIEG